MKLPQHLPRHASCSSSTEPGSDRWALVSLSSATLLASLGTSIANVGLPAITDAFAASFQAGQWVVLAYLLAATTLTVAVGRIGDVVGRRRLLLIGVLVFTVASGLCSAALSIPLLITARALQGLGGAMMMTLSMALVAEEVPSDRIGGAMGLLGTMSAVGTALGPTLGGVLATGLGWRAMFLVTVPLGIITFLLARSHVRADRMSKKSETRFDFTGTAVLAVTIACFALAMTTRHARFGSLNVASLTAALLAAALFAAVEKRTTNPVVPLSVLRNDGLRSGLMLSVLVATVIMATLIVGPFYLTRTLGLSTALAGLVMSSGPIVAAMAALPSGRLVDRIGVLPTTVGSLAGIAVGCGSLALLPTRFGIAGYVCPLVLVTASYALFQTANNTSVVAALGAERRGLASGLLTLSRNLGLISGTSAMGTLFTIAASTRDFSAAPPEAVATGMRITFGTAAMLVVAAMVIQRAVKRPTFAMAPLFHQPVASGKSV